MIRYRDGFLHYFKVPIIERLRLWLSLKPIVWLRSLLHSDTAACFTASDSWSMPLPFL